MTTPPREAVREEEEVSWSQPCGEASAEAEVFAGRISDAPAIDRARQIWRLMDRSPDYLRGTDFEAMFRFAAENFAEIYQCARGHRIDPTYVAAMPFDFLQALAAVLEANGLTITKEPSA